MKYPEMVRRNARFRGPRESDKQTSSVLDIEKSINQLRQEFQNHHKNQQTLFNDIVDTYNNKIPASIKKSIHQSQSLKGGEL